MPVSSSGSFKNPDLILKFIVAKTEELSGFSKTTILFFRVILSMLLSTATLPFSRRKKGNL
jgi:hypothetical protein